MKKIVVICVIALIGIASCGPIHKEHRHSRYVRSGILTTGVSKQAFLDVWGPPDTATTAMSDEFMSANFTGFKRGFFKGRTVLEVWIYKSIGIKLLFNKNRLTAWHTDRSVSELKAAAKPPPE